MILFKPRIQALIALIATLIGALRTPPNVSKIPEKISFTPCHAFFQLPVNTPVMNVIIPLNIFLTPAITSPIPSNMSPATSQMNITAFPKFLHNVSNTDANIGPNHSISLLTTGSTALRMSAMKIPICSTTYLNFSHKGFRPLFQISSNVLTRESIIGLMKESQIVLSVVLILSHTFSHASLNASDSSHKSITAATTNAIKAIAAATGALNPPNAICTTSIAKVTKSHAPLNSLRAFIAALIIGVTLPITVPIPASKAKEPNTVAIIPAFS